MNVENLMDLDRQFDSVTAEKGAEGWASYFDINGVMLPGTDPIIGKELIYQTMKHVFSQNGYSLRWEPLSAKISKDGEMGFTYGRYTKTIHNDEGQKVETFGYYTSIWEKKDNGEWKIVLDMGN
ncbi:YybH family protein [Bacillus salitolerans]|uniref:YybH family protein n=1 Tax=Bacillus salitolerans TaxID=1437434 RepID=A0ABW4LYD7_9BACI